jgi:two-component system, cell cycle sensor histidine kinase and response regulator CckA
VVEHTKNPEEEAKVPEWVEEKIHRNEARLRSLVNILQCRTRSTQEFLDKALDEALNLMESKFGYIYFYHENRKQFILNTWSKDAMKECLVANPKTCYALEKTGVWGEAVRQRKPIILNDYQADYPLKKGLPEGHVRIVRFMTLPVFNDNQIIAVVGVANKKTDYDEMDVLQLTLLMDTVWKSVEIKKGEEALRESEEKYRRITENISDVVWITDLNLMNIYISPSAERLFGMPVDVYMNRTLEERFPKDSLNKIKPALAEELEKENDPNNDKKRTKLIEVEHYRADGSKMWISMNVSFIRDENEKPVGIQGVTRDITDRKKAEEALRNSEEKYRFLVEKMGDIVWTMDLDLKTTYVSPSIMRILGFTPEERRNHALSEVVTKESMEHILEIFEQELLHEKSGNFDPDRIITLETEFYHKNGSTLWMENIMKGVRNSKGELTGIYGLSRDITERKQAEKDREKLQVQLMQARKMESVGRLAGGVAHDFNNMLSVIIGHSELAMEQINPAHPLYSDLKEIKKAAERSANLTHQLLAFARKQTIAPRVLDLNETVEGMLKMLRRLIGEDIDLAWLPGRNLWPVKMDPSQIDQILANLCVNARDAIGGIGKVTIETGMVTFDEAYALHSGFPCGEYVLLVLSDNGCGMEKETLVNLFEPFFTTKDIGKGTGLGLAMIYGIVKQNNGFINVYSEPGKGTTFKIYLPRHAEIAEQISKEEPHSPDPKGNETILLVEDEPAIMKMGKIMLERLGYRVLAEATPVKAIQLVKEHAGEIHMLMTDVVMPEMNGRDLADQLHTFYPGIKTLFMSGYTANAIAHHGVLDEGVHFIQKPFSMQCLASKIREVLDSQSCQLIKYPTLKRSDI